MLTNPSWSEGFYRIIQLLLTESAHQFIKTELRLPKHVPICFTPFFLKSNLPTYHFSHVPK